MHYLNYLQEDVLTWNLGYFVHHLDLSSRQSGKIDRKYKLRRMLTFQTKLNITRVSWKPNSTEQNDRFREIKRENRIKLQTLVTKLRNLQMCVDKYLISEKFADKIFPNQRYTVPHKIKTIREITAASGTAASRESRRT